MNIRIGVTAALLSSFLLITGCDAVKSFFGVPTAAEVENLKKLEQMEALKKKREDSIARAREDSLLAAGSMQADSMKTAAGRFMIIVGSFKEVQNAPNMMKRLQDMGYEPETIRFENGFDVVSVYSTDSYGEACMKMREVMETPFCPEDIWIYDRTSGLHK